MEIIFPEDRVIDVETRQRTGRAFAHMRNYPQNNSNYLDGHIERDEEGLLELLEGNVCLEARNNFFLFDSDIWGDLLHCAAYYGYPKAVNLLLRKGSDVGAQDSKGHTALHIYDEPSATYKPKEIIDSLLQCGAPIEKRNHCGMTPLLSHIQQLPNIMSNPNTTRICEALMARGANIYVQGNYDYMDAYEQLKDFYFNRTSKTAVLASRQKLYREFAATGTPPKTSEEVYMLLNVWPLSDRKADVDYHGHMQQIFRHAQWPSYQHAASIVKQLHQRSSVDEVQASLLMQIAFPVLDKKTALTPQIGVAMR